MNTKRVKRGLRHIVGPKSVLDDPASLTAYSYDSSLQSASPDLVIFPQTTDHVAEVVKLLVGEGIPYVARGAGTNLSGGSIPLRGGAVIVLARMKRILSIHPENQCARVEPGLTNLALQEALARRGFFYAPDPASQKVSTLGGNFAENSGGPHCLKYGVTTNHVLGAKVVTPEGDVVELGGETLESPDAGLLGLLVGSEGTLGIATEITCRIMPLPESVKTMLAVFDSTEQAGRTVSDIIAAGILPATLEMMDNMIIRAVEQSLQAGYPTDAAAVLIIEIDGPDEGLDATAAEIEGICRRNEVREVRTARDEEERNQLWVGRRGAFGAVASLSPNYSVSDGTVPRTKLPEVLRRVAEVGRKYDLEIGNVFHAGDGNLHPLIFFDSSDPAQLEKVHRAGEEILDACIEAGGTITGEHGIGTEKIGAMPSFFGPGEIELMRGIKGALDPGGLCNPGKVLPEADAREDKSESRGVASYARKVENQTYDEGAACSAPTEGKGATGEGAACSAPTEGKGAPTELREAPALFQGTPTFSPETPTELAAAIKELRAGQKRFAPVGTRILFDRLPGRRTPDALIETNRLNTVVEHDAANLTATVRAGLTIGDLRKTLAESGQFLPLDAPAEATVGGIVASALAGPRRHAYGAVRDFILGLEFAGGDGALYRAGGKTVKNVAGYDFGKLLVGSWGTLGIITETTFRLLPVPKASGAILAGFEKGEDACAAASEIMRMRLNPVVASLLSSGARAQLAEQPGVSRAPTRFTLVLGAEGTAPCVKRQLGEFERICAKRDAKGIERLDDEGYERSIEAMNDLAWGRGAPEEHPRIIVNTQCVSVASVAEHVETVAGRQGIETSVIAHVLGGTLYCGLAPGDGDRGFTAGIVDSIARRFADTSLLVLGADLPGNTPFITGNPAAADWRWRIRRRLDPDGLLRPGMPEW